MKIIDIIDITYSKSPREGIINIFIEEITPKTQKLAYITATYWDALKTPLDAKKKNAPAAKDNNSMYVKIASNIYPWYDSEFLAIKRGKNTL